MDMAILQLISLPVSNATGGNEKKQQIKFSQFKERKQTQTMDINI